MAVQTLHCPEERQCRRDVNSGSVNPQRVHTLPVIQDVDPQRSQTLNSIGVLGRIHRSGRWILACANRASKETLPGFFLQRRGLAVPGLTIRPQHRTQSLHQADFTCSEGDGRSGYFCSPLSGRSSDSFTNKGPLSATQRSSDSNLKQFRLSDKLQEIKPTPVTKVPLVGHRMGFDQPYCTSFPGQDSGFPDILKVHCSGQVNPEKIYHDPSRPGKLHRGLRPNHQTSHVHYQKNLERMQVESSSRSDRNSTSSQVTALQMARHPNYTSTIGLPGTSSHHSDRRISERLGVSDRPEKVSRRLQHLETSFHQRSRIDYHFPGAVDGITEKSGHSTIVRQHFGRFSTEKRQLSSLLPLISDRTHMETSSKNGLDTSDFPYQGILQCSSRPAFPKHDDILGMVPSSGSIPKDSSYQPKIGSRSFCHTSKQQVTNLCFTMSGSGSSSGRSLHPLGQMETSVHVPTTTSYSKGIGETRSDTVLERNSSHSRSSDQTMVFSSQTQEDTIHIHDTSPEPDSSQQTSDNSSSYNTSRVEHLKRAYDKRFPNSPHVVRLLVNPIRRSSQGDYEYKWRTFCSFLRDRNIPFSAISLATALEFLTYLFHDKNLKPGTVAHYRSALSLPLRLSYNIDLNDQSVTTLLKAMALKRPSAPLSAPKWSLNTVLAYIDELDSPLTTEVLLQKAAFLLLLATGYRISELHACVRSHESCNFADNGTLILRPDSNFIAKNEPHNKRWNPKSIRPLFLASGTISNLCPVKALRDYLTRTPSITSGSMFLHHKTNKPLTVHQLSVAACKLVMAGDPGTKARVHDVRKLAASYSLAETMDISTVTEALHWRSPNTFWRYYMSPVPPLSLPVVLPSTSSTISH